MPQVTVEFYGIPRRAAGCESIAIEASTLADLLEQLAMSLSDFRTRCLTPDGRLARHFLANLDGQRFVSDPETVLPAGARVLILSADAGGS